MVLINPPRLKPESTSATRTLITSSVVSKPPSPTRVSPISHIVSRLHSADNGAGTSEEATQHAKEVLSKVGEGGDGSNATGNVDLDGKNPDNVARGLKSYVWHAAVISMTNE